MTIARSTVANHAWDLLSGPKMAEKIGNMHIGKFRSFQSLQVNDETMSTRNGCAVHVEC